MRPFFFLVFLKFSLFNFSQSDDLKTELKKIDSIVSTINETEKQYDEGIMEGPIIYRGLFKKNGGWEAYYLYDRKNKEIPLRIIYNLALRKTYESYEFYYLKGQLIFIKLSVDYYCKRKKNKSFKRKFYFDNSKLIFDSNPEIKDYGLEETLECEKSTRKMIFR